MNAFARVTEDHDLLALHLTPCASRLYRWLLRRKPAGRPQEFEANEFSAWTGIARKRPYSIRHIQRAVLELISLGLVEIRKQYTSQIFRLVAHHPSDENVQIVDKNVQNLTKMSKIEASKPCNSVASYREELERSNNHPTHPAAADKKNEEIEEAEDQGSVLQRQDAKVPDLDAGLTNLVQDPVKDHFSDAAQNREVLYQVRDAIAPIPLNPQIKKVVLAAALTTVQDAIALVKERRQKGEVKNPAGLLVEAIRGQWKPAQSVRSVMAEFKVWYEEACTKGVIDPFSTSDIKITGLPLGSIGVRRRGSEVWEDWRAIAAESHVNS